MSNLIPDGKHLLSGVCEVTVKCCYYGDNTAEGIVLTIDGKNYTAYTDPDDGYRSYGAFYESGDDYPQKNSFPGQQVMVSNEDWDEEDENGWPHRGNKIAIYNIETGDEIFSCGTIHDDSYYPVGFWHYHPEYLPINAQKSDTDKQFEDALSTLRKCLGMSDEHEEGCRIPAEKPVEDDDCLEFEPGCDYDADKFQAYDQLCNTLGGRSITQTEWEMMEHIVRERIKKDFQKFIDEEFDGYETSRLLFMLENFNLMK